MDCRKEFYDSYVSGHTSQMYDLSLESMEKRRKVYRSHIGRFLPADKSAGILDLGSGCGSFLYFLDKEGYRNAKGVDCSKEQVELGRSFGINTLICADITETLKVHNQEYDCITALEVLEHFNREELLNLLNALYNSLKPGGVFVMWSPNAEGPFSGRYRYGDITHEISFTKDSAKQFLTKTGFEEIKVYPVRPLSNNLTGVLRRIVWQFFSLIFTLYLAAETGTFRGHILTQNLIVVARKRS